MLTFHLLPFPKTEVSVQGTHENKMWGLFPGHIPIACIFKLLFEGLKYT